MNIDTLDILLNNFSKVCDNRVKKSDFFDLLWFIFRCINQSINEGICSLDSIILEIPDRYQLLRDSIYLITYAIEPNQLEKILLNYIIFTNNLELNLLECILIIEGSLLIQRKEEIFISKEILKSYFGLDYKDMFDTEYDKIKNYFGFKESVKLTRGEVDSLLKDSK